MPHSNSQEQTIYRSLAGKIQLGFYDNGKRFPSAKEIAGQFHVSYCPAQRALKALERDGLVRLCRGKETLILKKPFNNYLASSIFLRRAKALADLNKSLELISPALCVHGMGQMASSAFSMQIASENFEYPMPLLYCLFEKSLKALKNQTALSLYYDIGAFSGSAYLDILYLQYGKKETDTFLNTAAKNIMQSWENCRNNPPSLSLRQMEMEAKEFFGKIDGYLEQAQANISNEQQDAFLWEPHKGRPRYCDVIAIDMICKINQGIYPVGTLLPNGAVLAEIYHVSAITMRRTIILMNQLGVTKTINGIGTRVVSAEGDTVPYKLKGLMLDHNLREFLEALHLLAITCEPVIKYTFSSFTEMNISSILDSASLKDEKRAMVAVISASMQAIVNCCPLAAIGEIYSKLTLLLLKGSVLRLSETGEEHVEGWRAISEDITKSLNAGNGTAFAQAFRQLAVNNFVSTKETLLEIGVSGIDELAFPFHNA